MDDAISVLSISVKEQEVVVGSIPSLLKQRLKILPNPDHLDEVIISDKKQNLMLIPRAEKRSKNEKSEGISTDCNKQIVSSIELKKTPKQCLELDIIGATA
jgi:hypothetical protein